jgi:transglutaminase-like putative cysteine protease
MDPGGVRQARGPIIPFAGWLGISGFDAVRIEISHTSVYAFSRPVFLEPHTVRLRPRCDASQHLIRFALEIEPAPAGLSEGLDVEGNSTAHVWFDGSTDRLSVVARIAVETLRENPFDYILDDPAIACLPMPYPVDLRALLEPCLSREGPGPAIDRFARAIADETEMRPLPFLMALTRRISQTCRVALREEGEPQPPEVTLAEQRGACRDLAVVFMEACRALGLAARFVSGYQEGDPAGGTRDLHAWAEVYLPGGGWRGYDPTLGLAVADRHVALAASAHPRLAAPISGTFRGAGASSRLQAHIQLGVSRG